MLLAGPPRWHGVSQKQFARQRPFAVLDRLYWLHQRGCTFGFDVERKAMPHRAKVPEWKIDDASRAAASHEAHGGYVHPDTTHDKLLNEPLNSLLAKAADGHQRAHGALVEHDSMGGQVASRPVRVLAALRRAGTERSDAVWGWQRFLNSQARSSDKPRLIAFVACRISALPAAFIGKFLSSVTRWFTEVAERLGKHNGRAFTTSKGRYPGTIS